MKESIVGSTLRILPKNHLSAAVGWLARRRLPGPAGALSVRLFAQYYGINLEEAEKPVSEYPSIAELFVRGLKAGARPIADEFVVHPCDARLTQFGAVEAGKLVQAKGKWYSVSKLLGEDRADRLFSGGQYATYYLCPTDYHRVHSPVDGRIVESVHIPGRLWPVNDWSVRQIEALFSVNERVVTWVETDRGMVAVVMVGATNVGKITIEYDTALVTNRLDGGGQSRKRYDPPIPFARGQELGRFRMGSTVIVLFARGVLREVRSQSGDTTRVGEKFSA